MNKLMKTRIGLFISILFLCNPSFSDDNLDKIQANHIGSRLGMVRVCTNLSIYKENFQSTNILKEYDKKVVAYIVALKDKERLAAILNSLRKMQIDMMESTGVFNWNTSCIGMLNSYNETGKLH
jgi:hypothetical protein